MRDWVFLAASIAGILAGLAAMIIGWLMRPRKPIGKRMIGKGRIIECSNERISLAVEDVQERKTLSIPIHQPFPMAALPEDFALGTELDVKYHESISGSDVLLPGKLSEYAQQWLDDYYHHLMDWYLVPIYILLIVAGAIAVILGSIILVIVLFRMM